MAEYGNDPVSAVAEEDAVGEVADIFADIRGTMSIPLLTSIWRTLVSVDGGLEAVWKAAKPLYLSGQPELALSCVIRSDSLPVPKPLAAGQLQYVGLSEEDIIQVRAIVAAYNRSNGMNMLALGCLLVEPSGRPLDGSQSTSSPSWPPIRRLLPRDEIAPEIWKLLLEINRFGSVNGGGLATLWRHLAHWPGLLNELQASFLPIHRSGRIQQSVNEVHELSTELAGRMAHIRSGVAGMPEGARRMVEDYVAIPGAVTRMVTLGHAVAKWLDPK